MLLFLFGSKDGLVRALLARARTDEIALLDRVRRDKKPSDLAEIVSTTWGWLAAGQHRALLTLWAQAYARSLTEPDGPWAGFARQTVEDWLGVLATGQPPNRRRSAAGAAERSLALAVLRGSLLDLLPPTTSNAPLPPFTGTSPTYRAVMDDPSGPCDGRPVGPVMDDGPPGSNLLQQRYLNQQVARLH